MTSATTRVPVTTPSTRAAAPHTGATDLANPPDARPLPSLGKRTAVVELTGEINDYAALMLKRRYAAARKAGAESIILKINTPGGAVISALEITRFIKSQSDGGLHTVALVHEMAYSAGSMIALACDGIVMEPGAYIGDCAPIVPGQNLEPTERAKAEAPLLAEFYDSAQRNGYDDKLVQAMVSMPRVIYAVERDGRQKFADQASYDRLKADGWDDTPGVPVPLDGPSSLLTMSTATTVKIGLAKAVVRDASELAGDHGALIVATYEHSAGETFLAFLNGSTVRFLVFVTVAVSGYIALTHPGTGAAEAVCLTALGVLLGVPLLTGWASWLEVSMIVIGIGLLAAELFVIPGFGIAGISGLLLIFSGLLMTFVPPDLPGVPGLLPSAPAAQAALKRGLVVIFGGLVMSLGLWFWLARYLERLPFFSRMVLQTTVGQTPEPGADEGKRLLEAAWPAIGTLGQALTDLRPSGRATFLDEIVDDQRVTDVVAERGYVRAGTPVVVRDRDGLRIVVREVET